MRLFIVTSVYQFLNALTVQLNNPDEKGDLLCVCDLLENTFDLEKLHTYGLFENVYSWTGEINRFMMSSTNKDAHFKNTLKKVGLALNNKKLTKNLPRPQKEYDEICVGYPDYPTRLAAQTLRSKNTKFSLLEEGTYTYEFLAQKQSFLKKTAFKIFIGADIVEESEKVYVYRPEILQQGDKQRETIKILPELEKLGEIIRLTYKQEIPAVETIDKPFIMFDETMEDEVVNANQNRIALSLVKCVGADNCVVKMHPKYTFSPYDEDIPLYTAKCPFEILMSAINIEKKALVSILSTACINPKMMLDAEPYIIFTVKISGVEQSALHNPEMLKIIDRVKSLYRNPERIFVPETFEEFEQIVNFLQEN